jgi:hypothetical protein
VQLGLHILEVLVELRKMNQQHRTTVQADEHRIEEQPLQPKRTGLRKVVGRTTVEPVALHRMEQIADDDLDVPVGHRELEPLLGHHKLLHRECESERHRGVRGHVRDRGVHDVRVHPL